MSKKHLESIFLSPDLFAAVIISIVIYLVSPTRIRISIIVEILRIAISVLSIVFSVYFAALAIIITSGDNDFIDFLEEDGSYSHIIWTFKITLLLLFFSLVVSIIIFTTIIPFENLDVNTRWFPKWGAILYSAFSSWSLFAAALATLDSIRYAEYRAEYISITNDDDPEKPNPRST